MLLRNGAENVRFDRNPLFNALFSGTLLGIKGQYLILDSGVLNIRKYTGYELELTTPD